MELLKHEFSKFYPKRESWLYKKEKSWYKEVHIFDENVEPIDMIMLQKYIDQYDWICKPSSLKFENGVMAYEMADYSHGKNLLEVPYEQQLGHLNELITIFQTAFCFCTESVFMHNDFRAHNIFIIDGHVKLIDLDSFRWIKRQDYPNWVHTTLNDLTSMFNLNNL